VISRSASLVAMVLAAPCAVLAKDPKVPPQKDPGAVPVALIGGGVDYTSLDIAKRLARDGEGNIVGWDFVDDDIFPYSQDEIANAQARLLLRNADVELVPIRVASGAPEGIAQAAGFLGRTEVRTVVVLPASADAKDWAVFAKAAAFFKNLLFVVPARADGSSPPREAPLYPAALGLPNVLSVAMPGDASAPADVAMAALPDDAAGLPSTAAIVLAAALATCHAAVLGEGDGASRKAAAIGRLAIPRSSSKVPAIEPCL
jgi:hypothetical protein